MWRSAIYNTLSCPMYNVGHVIVLALYSNNVRLVFSAPVQTWVSCPDVGPRLTSPALYLVPGKGLISEQLIRDKTADHLHHQCSEETIASKRSVDQIRRLLAHSKSRRKLQENRHDGNTALHVLFTTCVHIFAEQLLQAGALPLLAALIGKLESGTNTCELLPVWEHFPTTGDSYQLLPN